MQPYYKELILITRSAYIARYLTLTHTPYRNNSQGKHTERADLVWREVNIMQLLMRSDQDLIVRKPEKYVLQAGIEPATFSMTCRMLYL